MKEINRISKYMNYNMDKKRGEVAAMTYQSYMMLPEEFRRKNMSPYHIWVKSLEFKSVRQGILTVEYFTNPKKLREKYGIADDEPIPSVDTLMNDWKEVEQKPLDLIDMLRAPV